MWAKIALKPTLKLIGKLGLMVLAFWWISGKISWPQTFDVLRKSSVLWIFLAFLLFNSSKILSAFRLQRFWRSINVNLSNKRNIKLYYVGMFYNLFLPGGIGGDGYKVWLLKKEGQSNYKELSTAVIVDRVSGVIPLALLSIVMLWMSGIHNIIPRWIMYSMSIAFLPLYVFSNFIISKVSPQIQSVFHRSNIDGLGVQLLQLLCALCLLNGIAADDVIGLTILFLISSIVAVLPLTIGGVGAREWVMVAGSGIIAVSAESGIAMSLLFFAITALSSLVGAFISTKKQNTSE